MAVWHELQPEVIKERVPEVMHYTVCVAGIIIGAALLISPRTPEDAKTGIFLLGVGSLLLTF